MSMVEEQILNASDIIVNNAIQKAGYDKTIQAQVISCEDATIGKYKCRHQDSTFYAYSNNTDLTYTSGAYVYIHIPGNDMSKQKTILGTTNKLGINYISQAIGDQAYNIVGNNCISLKEEESTFYLYTNKVKHSEIIYKIENGKEVISKINLDKEVLKQSIQQSSSLIIGATIKTSIEPQRQSSRGHYGITYTLKFLNNNSNEPIIRSYTIDEDNMIGNPYRLVYPTRQYQIFDIDGPNFVQVVSIQIFNENFPNPNLENKDKADIEITKLQLNGAIRMSESELSGVAISFYTPQGLFFTESSSSEKGHYKTITAQVRIKGKLASAAQKIPFYWGKEHIGITSKNVKYNKYLGRGWQCLNDSNIITQKDEDNNIDPVVQWVPGGDTYIVKYEESLPRNNRFKVAIIYDNNIISKQINIQNLAPSAPEVTLESSEGTQFYFDSGETILSCVVTQQDKTDEEKKIQNDGENAKNFTYYWGYVDPNGAFFQLENTEKTYNVEISDISLFRNYKCSVYRKPTEENADFVYLGTAQITISNSLQAEGLYHLAIENGDMVFQYNENGIAPTRPTNKSLDSPQTLNELSFTLYDNTGHPIDANTIINSKDCEVTWEFPIGNDTLLIDNNIRIQNDPNYIQNPAKGYSYYKNKSLLTYDIASQYSIKKQRNQIKLTVNYKGMIISKETAFTFVKQGQPGTNGTQYVVKLLPNTLSSVSPPAYPMITKIGNTDENYELNYSLNSIANYQNISPNKELYTPLLKVQLWKSGQLIWEGTKATETFNNFSPTMVRWEVLKTKKDDSSLFSIENDVEKGQIWKINSIPFNENDKINTAYSNIIKCTLTIQGKNYYGTIPIITAWVSNKEYKIKLKDNTGFKYVIYSSDGTNPQYDNSQPFEFLLFKNNKDISKSIKKCIPSTTNENLLTCLKNNREKLKNNQYFYEPVNRYNGETVNGAVTCELAITESENNDNIIGRIHIPIHFLLNRFGLAHLNDWDGNSIKIDNNDGYILSPQIGAGQKETDNTFTGILMGQAKTAIKNNMQKSDIGLLGYYKGQRTIFLNSKNGSAIFGKTVSSNDKTGGQIIVDPSSQDALLYSSNYWEEYGQDGLPSNYNDSNLNSDENTDEKGLLINLSKAQIKYGSGNFYVTNKGHLHAAGGGDIAGWQIDKNSIHSQVKESQGRITLYTSVKDEKGNIITPGKIYSHSHDSLSGTPNHAPGKGFYLSSDGLSIGNRFKVDAKNSTIYLGGYAVEYGGVPDPPDKKIKYPRTYWTIDGNDKRSYISYGGNTQWSQASNDNGTAAKIYLGTDGFSLGTRFSINPQGEMKAYSGQIGGWSIKKGYISAESIKLKSDGSISGGYKQVTINDTTMNTVWSISQNGEAKFNRLIANSSGSIAGWTIGKFTSAEVGKLDSGFQKTKKDKQGKNVAVEMSYLKSGSLSLYSSGAIYGDKWSITKDGVATFSNTFNLNYAFHFNGTGSFGSGGSLSGGGSSWSGSGVDLSKSTTKIGGTDIDGYFKNLVVSGSFTYGGYTAKWQTVDYVSSCSLTPTPSITALTSVDLTGNPLTGYSLKPTTTSFKAIRSWTKTSKKLIVLCAVTGSKTETI